MSETLTQEHTDVMQRIQDINTEMRKAEIEHAFICWWDHIGSAAPGRVDDLYQHTEKQSRKAFHFACEHFHLPVQPAKAKKPESKINLLYSLFALGVVVGVFLTFALGLIIIQPK